MGLGRKGGIKTRQSKRERMKTKNPRGDKKGGKKSKIRGRNTNPLVISRLKK